MDKVNQQKTIYPNKTRKYLLPCLKEYGEEFRKKIENVFKVAVGMGDMIVDNCGLQHEKHIFILLESKIATKFFLDFLVWVRDQPMYEDDYVYGNMQKSSFHMVVLRIPEKFHEAIDKFRQGNYSEMFDKDTIQMFFNNHPEVKQVFIKDHEYKFTFMDKLNKWLGNKGKDKIHADDWHGEFDFPPTDKTDTFNHHLKQQL